MHRAILVHEDGGARGVAVRMLRHGDLTAADHARWAELSAAAGGANIFAQHWFMDAALRHSAATHAVRLAIVSRRDGAWLGILPLAPLPRFGRWPAANWQTWTATNQFLGSPLVRPDAARDFWNALLQHFDTHAGAGMLVHCRQFAWDDPICAALIDICNEGGRGLRLFARFDRAARLPGSEVAPDGKASARLRSLH